MVTINPVNRQQWLRAEEHGSDPIRILAGLLATGGVLWGAFIGFIVVCGGFPILLFALPGYAVTYGYIVRACRRPVASTRRWIWFSSALVQTAWLALFLSTAISYEYASPFLQVCLAWWSFASIASLFALFVDR